MDAIAEKKPRTLVRRRFPQCSTAARNSTSPFAALSAPNLSKPTLPHGRWNTKIWSHPGQSQPHTAVTGRQPLTHRGPASGPRSCRLGRLETRYSVSSDAQNLAHRWLLRQLAGSDGRWRQRVPSGRPDDVTETTDCRCQREGLVDRRTVLSTSPNKCRLPSLMGGTVASTWTHAAFSSRCFW